MGWKARAVGFREVPLPTAAEVSLWIAPGAMVMLYGGSMVGYNAGWRGRGRGGISLFYVAAKLGGGCWGLLRVGKARRSFCNSSVDRCKPIPVLRVSASCRDAIRDRPTTAQRGQRTIKRRLSRQCERANWTGALARAADEGADILCKRF